MLTDALRDGRAHAQSSWSVRVFSNKLGAKPRCIWENSIWDGRRRACGERRSRRRGEEYMKTVEEKHENCVSKSRRKKRETCLLKFGWNTALTRDCEVNSFELHTNKWIQQKKQQRDARTSGMRKTDQEKQTKRSWTVSWMCASEAEWKTRASLGKYYRKGQINNTHWNYFS